MQEITYLHWLVANVSQSRNVYFIKRVKMSRLNWYTVKPLLLVVMVVQVQSAIKATLNVVTIPGSEEVGTCPPQERRDEAIQNVITSVQAFIENNLTNSDLAISLNCGAGQWHRVAYLNLSNTTQQCPSAWREYNTSGVKGCRRPETRDFIWQLSSYFLCHQSSVQQSVRENYWLSDWKYGWIWKSCI